MYLLIFLFGFFILNKNVDALNENFCVNCQHFISVPGCNNKVGRCRLFPKKDENKNNEYEYLVSGKRKIEYRFCNFVREEQESCGPSGKYFMKKIFPFPKIPYLSEKLTDLKNKFKLCNVNKEKELEIQNEMQEVQVISTLNNNSNESIPSSNNINYID